MIIIDENTVVVSSFSELKSILEEVNTYNYVYLSSDITLTSGIKLSSSKTTITIDGTYDNVRHKYIDMKSTSGTSAMYVSAINPSKVIIKNMDVTGYNYYGIVYVPDSSTYQSTTIEYNNISYVGTQCIFNPYGISRIIDSNITIQDSYSVGNEVAECNKVFIGGNTTINHTSTSNSSFWFRNTNPTLTIEENAVVNFTSASRELLYGVTNLTFNILENAYFSVTTKNGFGYGTNGTGVTTIGKNATFILKQTGTNGSYALWYSYGNITVNEGATLDLKNNYTGITASNYNIYFSGSNLNFNINNPKKVVLYNSIANVIYASSTVNFNFSFNRINLFNTSVSLSDNISLNTLPTYSWYKDNLSNIVGIFSSSTTTITSNNYTTEELSTLPALSNFNFPNKKIMSIGTYEITNNVVTNKSKRIYGASESNSSILVSYNDVNDVVNVDGDGNYTYSFNNLLDIGTIITIQGKSYNDVIYVTKKVTVIENGELVLVSAPANIDFVLSPVSLNPLLLPRKESTEIVVTDNRIEGSAWKLYASIDRELTSKTGKVLKDSLVFVNRTGVLTKLSVNNLLIHTEDDYSKDKTTTIKWDEDKGILVNIVDKIDINEEYTANITFSLEE